MAELKTKQNELDARAFVQGIADPVQREDCTAIMALMQELTGEEPRMWGEAIVGFGSYHYRYASGREGDCALVGFSPRKQNVTLYLSYGFDQDGDLMQRLGKYKTGKACLYVKRLVDIDVVVLRELIVRSIAFLKHVNAPVEA